MKKNIFYICLSFIISNILFLNIAKAIDINHYIGLNGSLSRIRQFVKDTNNNKKFLLELNTGINFGINNKLFIAPEFYFNVIDTVYKHSLNVNYVHSIEIKSIYGLKINFGYNITEKLNIIFLTGINHMNQNLNSNIQKYVLSKEKWGYSFGFGLGYKISKNTEFKMNYEYQKTNFTEYNLKIHQARIGLAYNFN